VQSEKRYRVLIDYPIPDIGLYGGLSFPPVLKAGLARRKEFEVFDSTTGVDGDLDAIIIFNGGSHRDLTDLRLGTFSWEPLAQELYTKKPAISLRIGRYLGLKRMRFYDRLLFRNREYEKTILRFRRKNPSARIIHRLDGNYRNICKRYGFDASVRFINDLADVTIHQSEYSKWVWETGVHTLFGKTQTLVPKNSKVISNAVNAGQFSHVGPKRELKGTIRLLHVSASASPNKGLHTILELANILRDNHEVQFYLVGNQLMDPLCGSDIAHFENVHFLGAVKSRDELAEIYRSVDIFVFPSVNDCSPNVILESMSCGTPVVAIDSGGSKELIIKSDYRGGVLIEPLNPVTAIRTIIDHKNAFSEGALQVINKYHSLDQMIDRYSAEIKGH
jgi:glycosyltransferase involved in cell wall biosynthesis